MKPGVENVSVLPSGSNPCTRREEERREEILTTASIIQREARLSDDFFKVSRVIANRLADGMPLQMDSTAQYGYNEMHDGTVSSSAEALEDHEKTLISVVRAALTDSDEDVREAAAEAFDSLQQILGKRAVDQVLPFLLSLLRSDEQADNALAALLTLLTETTRSNIILPNLIPTLISPPISAFNAKALASLHSRPEHPWTVEELAREVGLSRTVLADRFMHYLGQPPIQYLTKWRLSLAADRLRDGNASIVRVAEQAGYDSEASFNRAFKREFGLPPATWRRKEARAPAMAAPQRRAADGEAISF